jgi:hypothetical protein
MAGATWLADRSLGRPALSGTPGSTAFDPAANVDHRQLRRRVTLGVHGASVRASPRGEGAEGQAAFHFSPGGTGQSIHQLKRDDSDVFGGEIAHEQPARLCPQLFVAELLVAGELSKERHV